MGFLNDFSTIIYIAVALVIAYGLTEGWRTRWLAQRKRERQNRAHDRDAHQ
jgi:hypothetical protein